LTVPTVAGLHAAPEHQSPQHAGRAVLASALDLTTADIERLDSGQVVSGTLAVNNTREVATFGVVRIKVTPEFYIQRLVDIASFKRDDAIVQIGTFGTPPGLQDVADLTLDDADIRSLRACRVGSCGMQLSAEAIERFRREIDWQQADASRRANLVMREMLVEYAGNYQKRGAAASMEYANRTVPLNLATEFASLSESADGAWRQFPAVRQHLFEYPRGETAGAIDVVYWSKERVARRGVVSVTHLAICPIVDSPVEYAIASKHIYGTHYFDASLGLTLLVPDRSTPSTGTYLVYVNRSRVNVFEGMFGGLARKIVTLKARSTVSDQLTRMQRRLERQSSTPSSH